MKIPDPILKGPLSGVTNARITELAFNHFVAELAPGDIDGVRARAQETLPIICRFDCVAMQDVDRFALRGIIYQSLDFLNEIEFARVSALLPNTASSGAPR